MNMIRELVWDSDMARPVPKRDNTQRSDFLSPAPTFKCVKGISGHRKFKAPHSADGRVSRERETTASPPIHAESANSNKIAMRQ